jgi:TonB family protein
VVLHLDQRAPLTPRLPRRRFGGPKQLGASAALHLTAFFLALSLGPMLGSGRADLEHERISPHELMDIRHVVFLAPDARRIGGGGGGGGNQQSAPIRRAQGVGTDAITLRVRKSPPSPAPVPRVSPDPADVPALPAIVLEATPLASGAIDQIGLPMGGVLSGTSRGPGSGGGVGTGVGTGIGSGRGSGLGPGSGGGTGGGAYRAGGAVTSPRLIVEVKPKYTSDAMLRRIQGTVTLEVVVTSEGRPTQIRVVRSLDPGGLDQQAIAATEQWRFEPGRLAGRPVDVVVLVMLDFTIR